MLTFFKLIPWAIFVNNFGNVIPQGGWGKNHLVNKAFDVTQGNPTLQMGERGRQEWPSDLPRSGTPWSHA